MLGSWWEDVRFAARLVRDSPGLSAVIVGCLALGIGPSTTAFSLINASLLRPLDVEAPSELNAIQSHQAGRFEHTGDAISYPDYVDLRDRLTTLRGLAVAAGYRVSVRSGTKSDWQHAAIVSPNHFDVLGRSASLGEVFHATDDDTPGSQPVVVLGHGYWQANFRGDSGVVGKPIRINGHEFTIAGVMPASFTGHMAVFQPAFWAPATMMDQLRPNTPSQLTLRDHGWMQVFGRVRQEATLEQVQDELADISRQLATELPRTNEFQSFTAQPFSGIPAHAAETISQLVLLAAVVVLVLLMLACSSTAALQLARATVRRREITIRMAIGASRWRIVRQLLVERKLCPCSRCWSPCA